MIRWFDHYLKGIDNGVEREPVVRYYVMGAVGEGERAHRATSGVKRRDWPVPARETAYYLHGASSGPPARCRQETARGSRPRPSERSAHPAPMPGALSPAREMLARPRSIRACVPSRPSLTEPVEWTGKVRAELFVSSTAPDTDFIVRVSDVYPDGRSILIIDYIRRARFRDSWDAKYS